MQEKQQKIILKKVEKKNTVERKRPAPVEPTPARGPGGGGRKLAEKPTLARGTSGGGRKKPVKRPVPARKPPGNERKKPVKQPVRRPVAGGKNKIAAETLAWEPRVGHVAATKSGLRPRPGLTTRKSGLRTRQKPDQSNNDIFILFSLHYTTKHTHTHTHTHTHIYIIKNNISECIYGIWGPCHHGYQQRQGNSACSNKIQHKICRFTTTTTTIVKYYKSIVPAPKFHHHHQQQQQQQQHHHHHHHHHNHRFIYTIPILKVQNNNTIKQQLTNHTFF